MDTASTKNRGGRLVGQVDLYSIGSEDEAVEALVIMAVSKTERWKIPIAYFLINEISSSLKTEIIKITIEKLMDAGAKFPSITCDGPISIKNILENLGAELDVHDAKHVFCG